MALIRVLQDIAYSYQVPNFKAEPYDLGSFDEIAHYRGPGGGRAETFEAGFEATPRNIQETIANDEPYHFKVTFGKNGAVPVITRRRITYNGSWIEDHLEKHQPREVRFRTPRSAWTYQPSSRAITDDIDYAMFHSFFILYRRAKSAFDNRENRSGLVARVEHGTPGDEDWDLIRSLGYLDYFNSDHFSQQHSSDVGPNIYAGAPVRVNPSRTYDPARLTRDSEGDHVPMYLANLCSGNKSAWTALKKRLEDFGKSAGLFDEIAVSPSGRRESEPFQLQVRKFGGRLKGPSRNLIDVGYGVSQVLPVITEVLRPDPSSIFLLQQPEIHLHPSAQAALGSLFCQVAGQRLQLVVETHSDHLMDRVRMDVRDRNTPLRPKDVSILFFERIGLDVRIHSLRIDEEGNILHAPDSYRRFFMEETARSLWPNRTSAGT